jgi:hypothetical protein
MDNSGTPDPLIDQTPLKTDIRALLFWITLIGTANLAVDLPGRDPLPSSDLALTLVIAVLTGIVLGASTVHMLKPSIERYIPPLPWYVKPMALAFLFFAWLMSAYAAYTICLSTSLSHLAFVTSRSCWQTQELAQIFFFVQMFTGLLWVHGRTWPVEKESHAVLAALSKGCHRRSEPNPAKSSPVR